MRMKAKGTGAEVALALLVAIAPQAIASGQDSYRGKIAKFRAERETELKADDGWLSLAGLFWLKEGENRFGADPSNEVVLPEGSAPPRAGAFELRDGKTILRVENGATITLNGKAITRPVGQHCHAKTSASASEKNSWWSERTTRSTSLSSITNVRFISEAPWLIMLTLVLSIA